MSNIKEQFKDYIGEDVRLLFKNGGHISGKVKAYNSERITITLTNARCIFRGKRHSFKEVGVGLDEIKDIYYLKVDDDER